MLLTTLAYFTVMLTPAETGMRTNLEFSIRKAAKVHLRLLFFWIQSRSRSLAVQLKKRQSSTAPPGSEPLMFVFPCSLSLSLFSH
jgi:hypothetical protein